MEKYGILLGDDEPAYHSIVAAILDPAGISLTHADSGDAVISAVSGDRFGLILMDIQLGAADGRELAARIRTLQPWAKAVPIIAFTTLRPAEGEDHFRDHGMDGWLPKPFKAAELIDLVRRWLGEDAVGLAAADRDDSRLAALVGADGARGMIERLHGSLAEAITDIDGGGDRRRLGHRIGGLAGMLGFPALSAAWLSLQDNEDAWSTVRALTIEAIDRYSSDHDRKA